MSVLTDGAILEHLNMLNSLFFVLSISLIEPGPVITEFERKVYEEGLKTDLSKADEVTADMFTNIYLKNYKQIFETLGQTADDIAEVSRLTRTQTFYRQTFSIAVIYN